MFWVMPGSDMAINTRTQSSSDRCTWCFPPGDFRSYGPPRCRAMGIASRRFWMAPYRGRISNSLHRADSGSAPRIWGHPGAMSRRLSDLGDHSEQGGRVRPFSWSF